MSFTLFSTEGCARCKILKSRMAELGIAYEEHDFKSAGKDAFQQFYTANRKAVYRGPEGIEFPILTDGVAIKQGVGTALAYLEGGAAMDGFFRIGVMRKEWLDGINVSHGDPAQGEKFLTVLRYLKSKAMKMVIETNGRNADLLEKVLAENLADKIIMNVPGPLPMYSALAGMHISHEEVERTIGMVSKLCEYQFQTTVVPVLRSPGEVSYLTPAEIGETAKLIEAASGSKKQPYLIKFFRHGSANDPALKGIEPMTPNMLFPYRTAARAYQVGVEIEKEPTGTLGHTGKLPCMYQMPEGE